MSIANNEKRSVVRIIPIKCPHVGRMVFTPYRPSRREKGARDGLWVYPGMGHYDEPLSIQEITTYAARRGLPIIWKEEMLWS